jgi:hypothetical protein
LPFFVGNEGRFTFRNHQDEQCDEEECFWTVDAVRVTWMGDRCHQTGVATVQVRSDADAEATSKDLQKSLTDSHTLIKATLELKLDSEYVEVLAIVSATGRRLQETSSNGAFDIHFTAWGVSSATVVASDDLKESLQQAFSAAGAGLVFESASLRLDRPSADSEEKLEETDCMLFYAGITLGSVAFCLSSAALAKLVCSSRNKQNAKAETFTEAKPVLVAPVEDTPVVHGKAVDIETNNNTVEEKADTSKADDEIRSVSTGEPGSDGRVSEAAMSDGASNNSDNEPPMIV